MIGVVHKVSLHRYYRGERGRGRLVQIRKSVADMSHTRAAVVVLLISCSDG
jgi:hypothetical protein